MDCERYFCSNIPVKDGDEAFLMVEWLEDGVKVLVIKDLPENDHFIREGFLPLSSMETKANELEVPLEDVISNSKEALTAPSNAFLYELNTEMAYLQWTKLGEINVDYGSVELSPIEERPDIPLRKRITSHYEEFHEKLKNFREQNATQEAELRNLQEENARLAREHQEYVEKSEQEKTDYLSKFSIILNNTQRHNAALQEEIQKLRRKLNNNYLKDQSDLDPESQNSYKDSQGQNGDILGDLELPPVPRRPKTGKKPRLSKEDNDIQPGPSTSGVQKLPEKMDDDDDDPYFKPTQDMDLLSQM